MCFSAQASFVVGTALLSAGAYCAWQALRKERRLLPLALAPAFFGLQQITEGFVWLALNRQDSQGVRGPALSFLFFALAFWPFWIPLCASSLPLPPGRRWAARALLVAGLSWAAFLYGPIFLEPDRYLTVRVLHHSVGYDYSSAPIYRYVPQPLLRVLYFATVALPLLLGGSGSGLLRGLGVLFAASALVSHLLYSYAFASVWCFFAAILSAYLCLVFRALPLPAPPELKGLPGVAARLQRAGSAD